MIITIKEKIGQCGKVKNSVSGHRYNPRDFRAAVYAAHYYAKRENKRMVVAVSSPLWNCFYIAREGDALRYAPNDNVVIVNPQGEVFWATAR